MDAKLIRNFSIIAHIDHGKSTLADRLMELTATVEARDMKEQLLDKMDLEREKGITIKLAPVRMEYEGYELNLIDTPGHVDFSYEVSRSLQACEGAILVVDATQGIQAQTIANVYLAIAANLVIIPVINKIDLPAANIDKTSEEIIALLGGTKEDICLISAKSGKGVDDLLKEIVKRIPPPKSLSTARTRCLIFDSYYDDYRGVILYIRVFDGQIKKNDQILTAGIYSKTAESAPKPKTATILKGILRIGTGADLHSSPTMAYAIDTPTPSTLSGNVVSQVGNDPIKVKDPRIIQKTDSLGDVTDNGTVWAGFRATNGREQFINVTGLQQQQIPVSFTTPNGQSNISDLLSPELSGDEATATLNKATNRYELGGQPVAIQLSPKK